MALLITITTCIYWFFFWLLNGLDKYVNRTDLALFTWYGNDRDEKFAMYFERLGIGDEWCGPVLFFAGVVELAIAGLFAWAIYSLVQSAVKGIRENPQIIQVAFASSILCFVGFSIFDVVVGDRMELWEHGTYLCVNVVCYVAYLFERMAIEWRKVEAVSS